MGLRAYGCQRLESPGDASRRCAEGGGEQLATSLQLKVQGSQNGVGAFADHVLMAFIGPLDQLDEAPYPWMVIETRTSTC